MSEFKFACPVCGQHMMCDTSQSGSIMECPTCFQKIVAPQAPTTNDPKFILTGTQFSEKKIPETLMRAAAGGVIKEQKSALLVISFLVIFLLSASSAIFIFRDKLFHFSSSTSQPVAQDQGQAPPPKPVKPAVVAPQASDTNWTLSLDGVTNFPTSTAAGRIHGQDFIVERAYFSNGTLTLRNGTKGPLDFAYTINFSGAAAEALAGHKLNVTTNADTAAKVTLHWKTDTQSGKDDFDSGYAMRLEFDPLQNNHLTGRIYLCLPDDQKSYLMGTFNADARKPRPKKPKN